MILTENVNVLEPVSKTAYYRTYLFFNIFPIYLILMYLELLYVSSILSASWNFFSLPCLGAVSEWLLGELLTKPACVVVI